VVLEELKDYQLKIRESWRHWYERNEPWFAVNA
jgi:hypothetical protein